jgi:hypothetical protein
MFLARAVVLWTGAMLVGLLVVGFVTNLAPLVPPRTITTVTVVSLLVVAVGSLCTWYYTFVVGLLEGGSRYALGHVLLCIVLTPVALAGIIFIPYLVYCDIDRWRQPAAKP